jgi:hypothetical protein
VVELGKLPSDLNTEELIEKRANAQRVLEFSKNLRMINKELIKKVSKTSKSNKQASSRERVKPL